MQRNHRNGVIREVWAGNFQHEFILFSHTLRLAGAGAVVTIDTEFPGVLQENAWKESDDTHYRAVKESVELLPVIQIAVAIGSSYGKCLGAWNFNLNYDLSRDFHTDAAVNFLLACGVDFQRHATEGIEPRSLGTMLQGSALSSCRWVTFAGMTDLLYLVQLMKQELPETLCDFEVLLEETCAGHHELRDRLPFGSLSSLARSHGVIRYGQAHTAGSDALVTLDLFFRISKSDDTHVESSKFDMEPLESKKHDPSNGSAAAVHLNPDGMAWTDRSAESRVASAL